jgi:hypothetical protein
VVVRGRERGREGDTDRQSGESDSMTYKDQTASPSLPPSLSPSLPPSLEPVRPEAV